MIYRYQFTLTKLKPFLNIGLSQSLKLANIDRSTTERKFFTAIDYYKDPIILKERAYEPGINLGFGININKINIELRAEATNGFAAPLNSKTNISSLFLNLNYLF